MTTSWIASLASSFQASRSAAAGSSAGSQYFRTLRTRRGRRPRSAQRLLGALAGRIGDARPRQHVEHRSAGRRARRRQLRSPASATRERLRDRIGEQRARRAARRRPARDPPRSASRRRCGRAVQPAMPSSAAPATTARAAWSAAGIAERDVNFPQHRGVPWPRASRDTSPRRSPASIAASIFSVAAGDPRQRLRHVAGVVEEDVGPEFGVAGGDPRGVAPAAGRELRAPRRAWPRRAAAAIMCGAWLVAASMRSCSRGDIMNTVAPAPTRSRRSPRRRRRRGGDGRDDRHAAREQVGFGGGRAAAVAAGDRMAADEPAAAAAAALLPGGDDRRLRAARHR